MQNLFGYLQTTLIKENIAPTKVQEIMDSVQVDKIQPQNLSVAIDHLTQILEEKGIETEKIQKLQQDLISQIGSQAMEDPKPEIEQNLAQDNGGGFHSEILNRL